jgi:polysaccharide deacetylase family protein (PEP-CTERM system associated)
MPLAQSENASASVINAMTVDVEDYFQVSAFEGVVNRDDWERRPCRVEQNTDQILEIFDGHDVKATFFMLGWVAERYPGLVLRIVDAGHELASHGYSHVRVTNQTREEFQADVRRTKAILEDTGGVAVTGFRAASFSIDDRVLWAFEVLQAEGYHYSSSIYPIQHDHYGMPAAPRAPFRPNGAGGLLEVPISTLELMGRKWPCGGGGYFRLLPYQYFRWAYRRLNRRDRLPSIFYFHPWEIDPDQPRPDGIGAKTRFRHYINLGKTEQRLRRLLSDFAWDRMDRVFLPADTAGHGAD